LDFVALRFWATARKVEFRSQELGYTNGDDAKKENGPCDLSSIAGRSKVKTRLSAHWLLRRVGRVRVHFAWNGLARFRCLTGVEFFIGSATAKSRDSAGKESETPPFHSQINNRRVLDFQRR
jgi:hypothetical protein